MPPPPPAGGRRSPEESTELILDAAQHLLWERPLGELTIGRLMAATPLGRSSFYVYFDGIDDLVARLLERLEGELWQSARTWTEGHTDPDGLRAAIAGVVQVWVDHGPVLTAIVQASWDDQRVHALWRDGLMGRFVDGVAAGIRAEAAAGHVDESLDPSETATALLMMNERYLMDRLGRLPQHDPSAVTATLQAIWTRTLYAA